MKKSVTCIARHSILLVCVMPLIAYSQMAPRVADPIGLNQSAWFQVQGFRASIDSALRLDNVDSGIRGTPLNLEDDLGLNSKEWLPSVLGGFRFGNGWRGEFEYYALKRSGTQRLDERITVDGTEFDAQAEVDSRFDTTVYRASIGYSFVRTPESEFGASLGLHVTRVAVAVTGIGSLNGGTASARTVNREKTVPMPTFGLYGTYALNNSWVVNTRADFLFLKIGDSKGRLVNVIGNVIYRFTPHIGAGVGYRFVDYNLKRSGGATRGDFDYRYSGPQFLLDVGF